MGHHRAASCSAIPSFYHLPSETDSISTQSSTNDELFYPSFCLYSKRALLNEYGPESDIVQYISPETESLKERLPIFVGILQSLFGVVNDMPLLESYEEEVVDVEDEEDFENNAWSPFTIIGLNQTKLVIWPNMYNNVQESVFENDLCLVVIVAKELHDDEIYQNMDLLKESLEDMPDTLKGNELGQKLEPLINYWFDRS
ncbi:hypothetical protein G6F56_012613 [Rhizopus delemar]|nr:hypothetical protein G6F56_012613 [Rhizopus delemar]